MGKIATKKSKVTDDRSANNAILQLVYEFLKRGDGTGEVAELLRKKTKLVMVFITVHCTLFSQTFCKKSVKMYCTV